MIGLTDWVAAAVMQISAINITKNAGCADSVYRNFPDLLQYLVVSSYLFDCCRLHFAEFLTYCRRHACSVHAGVMADVAMAAALTRSASVTDSPILVGTDALSSPMGAAGDRVSVSLTYSLAFYLCRIFPQNTSFMLNVTTIYLFAV